MAMNQFMSILIDKEDFENLLIIMIRYAFEKDDYITSVCAALIKRYGGFLGSLTLRRISEEISEKQKNLSNADPIWSNLLDWIKYTLQS